MFLRSLQKDKPGTYPIVIIWYALCWFSLFNMHYSKLEVNEISNPLLKILNIGEMKLSTFWLTFLIICTLLVLSVYTNRILYKHRIIRVRNHVATLFMLVFTLPAIHLHVGFLMSAIALILFIRILDLLFSITAESSVTLKILDLGLMLSLAAFFENTAMLLIPASIVALILMDHFNWREFIYLISGFLLPYLYLWSANYIFELDLSLSTIPIFPAFSLIAISEFSMGNWIQIGTYLAFIITASNLSYTIFVKVKVIRRRYFLISFLVFVNVLFAGILFSGMMKQLLLFFALPLTILAGLFFTNCKTAFINQLLLFLLLILYPVIGLLGW